MRGLKASVKGERKWYPGEHSHSLRKESQRQEGVRPKAEADLGEDGAPKARGDNVFKEKEWSQPGEPRGETQGQGSQSAG